MKVVVIGVGVLRVNFERSMREGGYQQKKGRKGSKFSAFCDNVIMEYPHKFKGTYAYFCVVIILFSNEFYRPAISIYSFGKLVFHFSVVYVLKSIDFVTFV